MRSIAFVLVAGSLLLAVVQPASAQKKCGPGVQPRESSLANRCPTAVPASGMGPVGRVQTAYFIMVNTRGGVNGRPVNFISLDDVSLRRRQSSRLAL
jgi:branched-chain amino acid transport system substrate-binding protein